jgi:hypothetical protein
VAIIEVAGVEASPKLMVREAIDPSGSKLAEVSTFTDSGDVPDCGVMLSAALGAVFTGLSDKAMTEYAGTSTLAPKPPVTFVNGTCDFVMRGL